MVANARYNSHHARLMPRQLLGPLLKGTSHWSSNFESFASHRSGSYVSGSWKISAELCTNRVEMPTTVPAGIEMPTMTAPVAGTMRSHGEVTFGDMRRDSLITAVSNGSVSSISKIGGLWRSGQLSSNSSLRRFCSDGRCKKWKKPTISALETVSDPANIKVCASSNKLCSFGNGRPLCASGSSRR